MHQRLRTALAVLAAGASGVLSLAVPDAAVASTSSLSGGGTPVVSAIVPSHGTYVGGKVVRITGRGFLAGAKVTFGGVAATSVRRISATEVLARTPAHPTGLVSVHVVAGGATSASSHAANFDYDGPAATLKWAPATTITQRQGGPAELSCPSVQFCAMVDHHGAASTFDGTAWTSPQPVGDGQPLNSVSCSSATFCLAVGAGGNTVIYNGTSWTAAANVPGNATSVSCASATFCGATVPGAIVSFDGHGWSEPAYGLRGGQALALDCPAPRSCYAVDGSDVVWHYDGSVFGGVGLASHPSLVAIDCAGDDSCVAVGAQSGYRSRLEVFDGTTWSPGPVLNNATAKQITCPTIDTCDVLDADDDVVPVSGATVGTPRYDNLAYTASLNCPTADTCRAVAGDGQVADLTGETWSVPVVVDPERGDLAAISCPDPDTCVAMDGTNAAQVERRQSWGPPQPVTLDYGTPAFSCATRTDCVVAVGDAVADFDTSTWSAARDVDPGQTLTSLSCPTTEFCLAADESGRVVMRNGRSWSRPFTPPVGREAGSTPRLVSCASASFCLVVDLYGRTVRYEAGRWTRMPTVAIGVAAGLSCPSVGFCALVAHGVRVATFARGGWSPRTILDPSGGENAGTVSCTWSRFCVLTGETGTRTFDGIRWSAPTPNPLPGTALSCVATDRCTEVGGTQAAGSRPA